MHLLHSDRKHSCTQTALILLMFPSGHTHAVHAHAVHAHAVHAHAVHAHAITPPAADLNEFSDFQNGLPARQRRLSRVNTVPNFIIAVVTKPHISKSATLQEKQKTFLTLNGS